MSSPASERALAAPTVATKLLVPPTPRHVVRRERLLDTLDEGVREGLVLLSAPAGAGKTVLLSSWIAARKLPGPACWLSLDGDDNDACRLLEDLLSALCGSELIEPGGALGRLKPPVGARTERFLALLVNGLAELGSPLVLVLDEIHELTSPQATAAIDFLVRHAPEQLRLVLAGRADPPLPIERLRVNGTLTELRIGDLAFDRDETAELCRAARPRPHRRGDRPAVGAHRGLGRGAAPGRALAARAPRAGALPGRVRRHRPGGGRLPRLRGARRPAVRPARVHAAHLPRGHRQPRAGRRSDRPRGRHADARARSSTWGRRWQRPTPRAAGTATTRCSGSCCARTCATRTPRRSPSCTAARRGGTPSRARRCPPSATPSPARTGSRRAA